MTKPAGKFKAWARKVDRRGDVPVPDGIEIDSVELSGRLTYYITKERRTKGDPPYLYLRRDLQWHETCGEYGLFSTKEEARETLQRYLQTL